MEQEFPQQKKIEKLIGGEGWKGGGGGGGGGWGGSLLGTQD